MIALPSETLAAPTGQVKPSAGDDWSAPPGTRIGNYRVVRELGRGGMGVVYEAEHVLIGRRAAVKVLRPELAQDPLLSRRFMDEARAATRIPHPAVVQVLDFCTTAEGLPCIVMEFLEGQELEQWMTPGPVNEADARAVLEQLADVLGAAHARGIVHRDVKPENVLVLNQTPVTVKLLDFGIARLDLLTPGVTSPGMIVGTPWYMAPEQALGQALTPAVDVYAVGVVGFRLLTGRMPFEGETPLQIMSQHVSTPLPDVPVLSTALGQVVRRALAKDPKDRFPDGIALRDALRRAGLSRRREPPEVLLEGRLLRVRFETVEAATAAEQDELARGRLFLPTTTPVPEGPLRLVVERPAAAPLTFDAEVVYRPDPSKLAAGAPAGVGLALRRAKAQPTQEGPAPGPAALLETFEARSDADAYAWLGVRPDAEMGEVKAALQTLTAGLSRARVGAAPALHERLEVLEAKLGRALDRLGTPAARARYDGRIGNFRGVIRCLAAGLPEDALLPLRQELLARSPERAQLASDRERTAAAHLAANRPADALKALEQALAADPLSAPLLRRYRKLRHDLARTAPPPAPSR